MDTRFPIALSCLHVIFDWMLLAIPITVLFQMRMSWQKKLRCILPLSIGGVSGAGAAVRVYESLNPGPDPTCKWLNSNGLLSQR